MKENRYFGENYVMSFAIVGITGTAAVHIVDVHACGYGENMRLLAYVDGYFYKYQDTQRTMAEVKDYVLGMFEHPDYVWRVTNTWIEKAS